jgi:hypothetical protein
MAKSTKFASPVKTIPDAAEKIADMLCPVAPEQRYHTINMLR